MIRKLTPNEKECSPTHDYIFERNGYKTWLTEGKFQQLAREVLELLKTEQKFCECDCPIRCSVLLRSTT